MAKHKDMKLGSLFDGIGGFPYAGTFFGITPAWASEILPCAVSVTKRHLPGMAHVGDITKLDGAKLPPVDIISFGSPCQGNAEEIDIPRKRECDCRNIDIPRFLWLLSRKLRDNKTPAESGGGFGGGIQISFESG